MTIPDQRFDLSLYRHKTEVRVRNYEVDWQGIVHNAVYLLYFELGRVDYLKKMGARLDLNSVRGENKVVLVRNEINYLKPVRFDELLHVHTRISRIKNTSFWMEGVLESVSGKSIVATNVAYHVWLDPLPISRKSWGMSSASRCRRLKVSIVRSNGRRLMYDFL